VTPIYKGKQYRKGLQVTQVTAFWGGRSGLGWGPRWQLDDDDDDDDGATRRGVTTSRREATTGRRDGVTPAVTQVTPR
jgi:hypothetical protein